MSDINPAARAAIDGALLALKQVHDGLSLGAQQLLAEAARGLLDAAHPNKPAWKVNDIGELGVEVNGRVYFLYKGGSLEYLGGVHDDGSPMRYRAVYKREFGECCHPELYWDKNSRGDDVMPDRYTFGHGSDWTHLPRPTPGGGQ